MTTTSAGPRWTGPTWTPAGWTADRWSACGWCQAGAFDPCTCPAPCGYGGCGALDGSCVAPWNDPARTVGQRVAAALDAGLRLGQGLSAAEADDQAFRQGYELGWHAGVEQGRGAAEWEASAAAAQAWRDGQKVGIGPSHLEILRNRWEGHPAGCVCGDCHRYQTTLAEATPEALARGGRRRCRDDQRPLCACHPRRCGKCSACSYTGENRGGPVASAKAKQGDGPMSSTAVDGADA